MWSGVDRIDNRFGIEKINHLIGKIGQPMKGRIANPLIQQLLTHGPKQKPYDLSVNRLYYALII